MINSSLRTTNSELKTMNWYVIQTKPRQEEEAATYLHTKGVDIFEPKLEAFSLRNGKTVKEKKPLFPGYLFGKFDLMKSYTLVRWGRGVKKVLGFGEYPTPVSEEVIRVIKSRMDQEGVVRHTVHFQHNDVVRIKSGPLKDLIGIFDRWVSDSERVRILMNLIGYQPEIEIHYSWLEKVA